jgi:hypothetical protein
MTELYTLYLSSQSNFQNNLVDNANKSNCTWRMNWDEFFNGANYDNKKCNVRFKLMSDSTTDTNFIHSNNMGYLACNLASSNQASTTSYTVLGLIYPTDTPAILYTTTGSNNDDTSSSIINANASYNCQILNDMTIKNITTNDIVDRVETTRTTVSETTKSERCFNISTFLERGITVNSPTGIQNFNLKFLTDNDASLQSNVPNYNILLQFEFI